MTARFLHSFPARNALRVVRQNQKMAIVTSILYLLGIPLIMAAFMLEAIQDSHNDGFYVSMGLYAVIGVVCLAAAVIMGMFAAIHSFTELHSKSKVDMLYALPLTGRQRFFSDFAGGCCMYILPYVVSVILGWIILLVLYPFIQQTDTDMPQRVYEATSLGEISRYYALLTFGLLALMLLYFALSSVVTICCGTLFESIYTNVLLNFLIPGTMAAVLAVIADNVELDFLYMWQCIGYMSPIGGMIYLFYLISDPYSYTSGYSHYLTLHATQTSEHEMMPAYLRWIFAIVVISALLVIAAWQLYTHRKAEHVSKPFVYLAGYYVMLTLVTVTILCILNAGKEVLGPTLLFAAIVYFVMEVIRKRGFKKFWLTIITYIVTVGVTIGMFAMVVFTDCFGRVQYVPPAATVSSVSVLMQASDISYYQVGLEFTDRDMISAITALHKEIVQARRGHNDPDQEINQALTDQRLLILNYDNYSSGNYADYPSYYLNAPGYVQDVEDNLSWSEEFNFNSKRSVDNYFAAIQEGVLGNYVQPQSVEISYFTISGSVIHRSYNITADEYMKLLSILQETDLFAQAHGDGLYERLHSNFSEYNQATQKVEIPNTHMLTISYARTSYTENTTNTRELYVRNAPQVIEDLSTAYRNDIAAMTAEQFRTSPLVCQLYSMPVYAACTETLALLEEYGFTGFSVLERYGLSNYNYYEEANMAVRIYAPGTYSAASLDYPCSTLGWDQYFRNDAEEVPAYQDGSIVSNTLQLDTVYPELYALMEAAQSNYISDQDCYALVINGKVYIVPPEHSDLAETVIKKGSWYLVEKGYKDDNWGHRDGWYYNEETGSKEYRIYPEDNDDSWYYDDDWYYPEFIEGNEYPA